MLEQVWDDGSGYCVEEEESECDPDDLPEGEECPQVCDCDSDVYDNCDEYCETWTPEPEVSATGSGQPCNTDLECT